MKSGLSDSGNVPSRAASGRAEQALDEARRANAAKDRLLAMMAHELKQPLTELLLYTESLLQLAPALASPKLHVIGEAMHAAVRRHARLIEDLLELSRISTGKLRLAREPIDMGGMVRAACATAALGTPNRQWHVDTARVGQTLCHVDPVRVEQILSNLLGNAVKFSPAGGRIDVQLAIERNHARISVSDTGCGIAADFLPHVFSMFGQENQRAGGANPGLGIGLALVRELTIAHGGRVEARSGGPGRGAQFLVWLPLAERAAAPCPMTHGDVVAQRFDTGLVPEGQHGASARKPTGYRWPNLRFDPTANDRERVPQPN
jgi:two-component system CheB/CheR fusion protein